MLAKLVERPNCLLNQRNRYQLLTTLLINLICIAHGINIGWFSPTMRKMQTPESPLSFPASVTEVSWIGSALGCGAMCGNALIGLILPYVGSRLCLLFVALPQTCLWFLVYFADSVEYLYVGRFLAGISSGGMYIVHSMFLSEISDAKIRGTLGAMVMLSVNIGVLLGYIMGSHIPFSITPFIVKGKLQEAEKSFRYYKNIKETDRASAISEFEDMKKKLTEDDKLLHSVTIKDFFSRSALKAYAPAAVLLILNQFSGLFAMVSYMSDIFDMSGSTMDPDTCTIIIGIVQILGTYATTLLCDISGRRILLVASSGGVAVSLTGFGFFTYFAQWYDLSEWSWVPLVLMSLCIFMGNIGLVGCFFMVLVELFPLKIRARATSIAVVICVNRRNRYQLLATVLINLICIAHGIGIGWLSPTLRKLQTEDSPLSFPLNVQEVSWVGSALGIGSVIGNSLSGLLIHRLGSKLCLLFIAIPHSCLWIMVYFAKSVEFLIAGRLLAGITGGGIYILHPLFISEYCDANIRGTCATMVMLSVNTGILIGYILGTHVSYYVVPFMVLILPLSYFVFVLLFIRDSPMHLISKGKFSAAEQSFRYYKNIKDSDSLSDQAIAMAEFKNMKVALTNDDNQIDKVTIKDFFTKAAIRGYGMAAVIVIANQFSGVFTMVNYMTDIFAKSGSTMDPNTSTIIIGSVQLFGAYVSTLLCDVFGRRALMLVSSGGVALSLTCFGFFTYYTQIYDLSQWSWVPAAIMSVDIFLGNIGLVSCLFVLMVEMYPLKIRARATSISIVVCSSLVFLMLNIFPLCMHYWGLPTTMWAGIATDRVHRLVIKVSFTQESKIVVIDYR
ncbi:hypothetical protein ACLKA6_000386 [Drosophila palustris]